MLSKFSLRKTIVVKWLVSYLFVFFVPVILGVAVYWETIRTIEREIDVSNETLIQQYKALADSRMKDLERIGLELSLNQQILSFSSFAQTGGDDFFYSARQLAVMLGTVQLSNEYIGRIFLYYPNSGTVITDDSRISIEEFKKEYGLIFSGRSWDSLLQTQYVNGFYTVADHFQSDGQVRVMHIRTPYMQSTGSPNVFVMFLVQQDQLLPNADRIRLHPDSYFYVEDGNGQIIASTNPQAEGIKDLQLFPAPDGLAHVESNGQKLTIRYTTSEETGWKIVSVTPSSVYLESVQYVKRITTIYMLVCLVVGALVTVYVLRRNYNPIQKLVQSMASRLGKPRDGSMDEYQYISGTLLQSLDLTEQAQAQLQQQNNALRNQFLANLIKGKLETGLPLYERLTAHDLHLEEKRFAVMVIQQDSWGKLATDDLEKAFEHRKLFSFFITNVVEELARQQNRAYVFEADDFMVCLLNGDALNVEEVKAIASHAKQFIQDSLDVQLTFAFSGIHDQIWQVPQAYQEALEALEHKLVMGSGGMMGFPELQSEPVQYRGYDYSLHEEQQIINLVKAGEYEQAKAAVEHILQRHLHDPKVPIAIIRCLMFDLIGTILRTMEELHQANEELELSKPLELLTNCKSVQEMQEQVSRILFEVTASINRQRNQYAHQFCERVKEYVHQHYRDPNLNISTVGDHFQITPSYLSKRFKEETGESLLEYINQFRIGVAKRLLLEKSGTVAEIALEVGYEEINTFNRLFKKYEGVTPGKYRDVS